MFGIVDVASIHINDPCCFIQNDKVRQAYPAQYFNAINHILRARAYLQEFVKLYGLPPRPNKVILSAFEGIVKRVGEKHGYSASCRYYYSEGLSCSV